MAPATGPLMKSLALRLVLEIKETNRLPINPYDEDSITHRVGEYIRN